MNCSLVPVAVTFLKLLAIIILYHFECSLFLFLKYFTHFLKVAECCLSFVCACVLFLERKQTLHFFLLQALSTVTGTVLKKYVRKQRREERRKEKGKGGVA